MQLTRLKVRNIRSYTGADLRLGPGTTLLSGDVGSGKTSLLYAIEMALFGFAEVDPVHLIRHRAHQAEVVLELTEEGRRYELRRRFSRKSRRGREVFEPDECVFGEDGAVRKYSPTELRQRAIELLGFPDNPNPRAHSDLWRWAVYIPQEQMRAVLGQDADTRRETVRKALGLEQYKIASDNAQLVARDLVARARRLEDRADMLHHVDEDLARFTKERDLAVLRLGELARQEPALTAEQARAENLLRRAEERAREEAVARAELEGIAPERRRYAESLQHLGRRRAEIDALLGEIAADSERIGRILGRRATVEQDRERANRELERLKAAQAEEEGLARERVGAERELAAGTELVRRTTQESERTAQEAAVARARLAERRSATPATPPEAPTPRPLEELDRAIQQLREDADAARLALAEGRRSLEEVVQLLRSGSCPRCHQSVESASFAVHLTESESTVAVAQATYERVQGRLRATESERVERERFDRSLENWTRARREIEDAEHAAQEAEERSHRALEALDAARDRLTEVQRIRTEVETRYGARPPVSRSELEGAQRRLAAVETEWAELARAEERSRSAAARRNDLEREREARTAEEASLRDSDQRALTKEEALKSRLAGAPAAGAVESARLTYRAASEQVESLRREQARAETERKNAEERVREAEAGRTRRTALTDAARKERKAAEFLSGPFREEVQQLEQRLLARAQSEFERVFARAFQTLVEDPTIAARTDGAFTPAVEIDGEWTPSEALSGGERTALALAFRIALGHVVRSAGKLRLTTLILDEPTDGFSPEQVLRLGELLEELGLPQVVLVSHETGLASIADHVVRVVKREGTSYLDVEDERTPAPGEDAPEPSEGPGVDERLIAR